MNRTRLAAILTALAGSVAGGVAIVQGVLTPGASLIVECAPEGDCVMAARPSPEQCPVLLEGGGDRPGEVSGLDGDGAKAARIVLDLLASEAISGAHTLAADGGCIVAIQLTREQAIAWREVLTGAPGDDGTIGEAVAVLTPTNPAGLAVQWGGGPAPEERTQAFDLAAVDAGAP